MQPFLKVPVYNIISKRWSYRIFDTKEDFIKYLYTQFRLPGTYGLIKTDAFQERARFFDQHGYYIKAYKGTQPYTDFWDRERGKCTTGVIYVYDMVGDSREWYITHWHYFYLNFLQIKWKDKNNQFGFPSLVDADINFFIYILLCKLEGKIACILKKRQFGATFKILAILVHNTWFYEAQTNKLIAYDDQYLNDDWSIISDYRDFLNEHTAWVRNFTGKEKMWKQEVEKRIGNKKIKKGNKSILKAGNAKDNPAKAVGGPTSIAFFEEAGVFPNLDKAIGFIKPAIKLSNKITGLVIISGSVGELKDCDPLKEMAFEPEAHDILSVDNIFDDDRTGEKCCLFIPEEWAYFGDGVDIAGNSLIEQARICMKVELEKELRKSPESERFFKSQHPSSLADAFDSRAKSRFNLDLIGRQLQRAQKPENRGKIIELVRDPSNPNKIRHKFSNKIPITTFPFKKADIEGKTFNKEGAIICWHIPEENPKMGTYYASVDCIDDEDTITSESFFSIDIYWMLTETRKLVNGVEKIVLQGDKHVATWFGRFAEADDTHEQALKLIEWYNARTLVEVNLKTFKTFMVAKKKADKYLIPKDMITFIGELDINKKTMNKYGYHKDSSGKLEDFFNTSTSEWMNEIIDEEQVGGLEKTRAVRGIERTNSVMHLKQYKEYRKGKGNYDAKSSLDPLIAFCRSSRAMGMMGKKDEREEDSTPTYAPPKPPRTPFNTVGNGRTIQSGFKRTIYKNMR